MDTTGGDKKWALQEYARYRQNEWEQVNIDVKRCFLLISNAQLLIINKETAIEMLNLVDKQRLLESTYTRKHIGFKITYEEGKVRKFKVSFSDNYRNKTGIESCLEVVGILKKFITVHKSQSGTDRKLTQDFKMLSILEEPFSDSIECRCSRQVISRKSMKRGIISTLLNPEFPAIAKAVYIELENFGMNKKPRKE